MEETIYQILCRGGELDEDTLSDFADGWLDDWERVSRSLVDHRRWHVACISVLRHKPSGTTWALEWESGATECQENEYLEQPYRVEPVEVTTVEYRRVKS